MTSLNRVMITQKLPPDMQPARPANLTVFTELKELRDMVVEQRVELRNMGASDSQVDELQKEVVNQRVEFSEIKIKELKRENVGIFTAPVRGVYYIRFTASHAPSPGYIGVYMYKNDKRIMFNYAHNPGGNRRFVVNAVTLELKEGDVVYMSSQLSPKADLSPLTP
ncbi:unnamed protein product [Coregonus sp. 'balchen']|nr:unnamed protein product [Coregonus sp. 'balchen']